MSADRNAAIEPEDEDTTTPTQAPTDDPFRALLRLIDEHIEDDEDEG